MTWDKSFVLKNFIKFLVFSIFFTIVVFFIKTTIFTSKQDLIIKIEEKHIEPEVKQDTLYLSPEEKKLVKIY